MLKNYVRTKKSLSTMSLSFYLTEQTFLIPSLVCKCLKKYCFVLKQKFSSFSACGAQLEPTGEYYTKIQA